MPIRELKQIIATQKTISTTRLAPLVEQIEKHYTQRDEKINAQQNSLKRMNIRYQREKDKADRRKAAMQDYENLKVNHQNLRREFNVLSNRLKG